MNKSDQIRVQRLLNEVIVQLEEMQKTFNRNHKLGSVIDEVIWKINNAKEEFNSFYASGSIGDIIKILAYLIEIIKNLSTTLIYKFICLRAKLHNLLRIICLLGKTSNCLGLMPG